MEYLVSVFILFFGVMTVFLFVMMFLIGCVLSSAGNFLD